jgi:hypothetical protein
MPLSPENVETDRSQIQTRLAADKIAERRKRVARSPLYVDAAYVPGGRSENITPLSQG